MHESDFTHSLNRGSYMSAHILLNLLNELAKREKCEHCSHTTTARTSDGGNWESQCIAAYNFDKN